MASTSFKKGSAFLARFLFTFFLSGSVKFGAVLFESFTDSGNFSNASTGVLLILPYAIARILGPVVTIMMGYVSARGLAVSGAFVFGSGYCCAGLLPLQPSYAFPCFFMAGFGLACMNIPIVQSFERLFGDKFRSMMPLSSLGAYAGITIVPNVAAYFQTEYGSRAALILFGVLGWNLLPCALCLSDGEPVLKFAKDVVTDRVEEDELQLEEQESLTNDNRKTDVLSRLTILKRAVMRNFVLLRNEVFLLFFLVANLRKIPNDAWTLYLIPHMHKTGLSLQTASVVGSLGGIGGLFGRFFAAMSFKCPGNLPLMLFGFSFILNGFIFVTMEILLAYFGIVWFLYLASFCNGLLLSAQSGMVPGILHLLITPAQYLTAYGFVDLGNGIWTLLASFGPGLLIDFSVGFPVIFVALGFISVLNGCMVLMIGVLVH